MTARDAIVIATRGSALALAQANLASPSAAPLSRA